MERQCRALGEIARHSLCQQLEEASTCGDSLVYALRKDGSLGRFQNLKEQIKVLSKAIEKQFEIIPNTLTSIPGIGKVYSAGIIRRYPPLRLSGLCRQICRPCLDTTPVR